MQIKFCGTTKAFFYKTVHAEPSKCILLPTIHKYMFYLIKNIFPTMGELYNVVNKYIVIRMNAVQ